MIPNQGAVYCAFGSTVEIELKLRASVAWYLYTNAEWISGQRANTNDNCILLYMYSPLSPFHRLSLVTTDVL